MVVIVREAAEKKGPLFNFLVSESVIAALVVNQRFMDQGQFSTKKLPVPGL